MEKLDQIYDSLLSGQTLSSEDEACLMDVYMNDSMHKSYAREILAYSQYSLVKKLARKYSNSYKYQREEVYQNFVSYGNEGLLESFRSFDPAKGSLKSHCTPWIIKYIHRAMLDEISKGRKISEIMYLDHKKIRNLEEDHSDLEIAKELGVDVEYIAGLREAFDNVIELDYEIDDTNGNDKTSIHEIIEDPDEEKKNQIRLVQTVYFDKLDSIEQEMFIYMFSQHGNKVRNVEFAAKKMNISKKEARLIYQSMMEKFKKGLGE